MEYFYLFIIICFSAFLHSLTGFGFAILAVPLCFLFFDQSATLVIVTFVSFFLNLYLLWKIKVKPDFSLLRQLLISGLMGVPIGVMVLLMTETTILKLVTVFFIFIFFLLSIFSNLNLRRSNYTTVNLGFLTGILQSSVGLNGPILAILLNSYGLDSQQTRKTLVSVFFVLSSFALPLFMVNNIFDVYKLNLSLLSLPAVAIGAFLGDFLSGKISLKNYRFLTFTLVLASVFYSFFETWKAFVL